MSKAVDDDLPKCLQRDFWRFNSLKTDNFCAPADIIGHIFDSFIDTFEYITPELLQDYTVIVNCTPKGMSPHFDECPDLPYEALTHHHLLDRNDGFLAVTDDICLFRG